MENQYFSVKEQVFEIQFTNRKLVHELQNRISKISNESLIDAMEDCFEKLIPVNALIKLDSLTVNIGEIDYQSLENELEPRLISALEDTLSEIINSLQRDGYSSSGEEAVIMPISSNEEVLAYFLMNGTLPWWVQQDGNFRFDSLIDDLYKENPELLRSVILTAGRNEFVRRRIVNQFTSEALQKIVNVLEPAEAAFIIGYHAEVIAVQKKEQLVQTEIAVFEKEVWLFILNYLLNERGGDFNRKTFVKSNLAQLAAFFNIEYLDVLAIFYQALVNYTAESHEASSLETFIRELTSEEEALHAEQFTAVSYQADPSKPKDPQTLASKADMLLYFFRYGTLPAGNNGYSTGALAEIFAELVWDIPQSLKIMLYGLRNEGAFPVNYYNLLGFERGKELINRLYPGTGRLLTTLSSLIEWTQLNQPLFNTDSSELKKMLSSITLPHILAADDHGNEDILVRSFLSHLARRYDVGDDKIISHISGVLQENFRQGIMNTNLPVIFERLVEMPGRSEQANLAEELIASEKDTDAAVRGLVDTLIYLVQYGNIPWWGKRFFETGSADEKFRELIITSPAEMSELVRMAGADQRWQRRLLSFVAVDTMYSIMEMLPFGKEGMVAVKQFMTWYERAVKTGTAPDSATRVVLQAFWIDLVSHAYRSFSLTGFFSVAVVRIAAYLGITPFASAVLFEKAAAAKGAATAEERDILSNLVHVFGGDDAKEIPAKRKEEQKRRSTENISPDIQKDQELEVMILLSTSLPQDGIVTGEKLHTEAIRLLAYFFTWNKLPADWDETPYLPLNVMLKQMLLLVYRENKLALQELLSDTSHIAAARMVFHELVTEFKGGFEKEVAGFIKPYKEQYQQIFFETERSIALQLKDPGSIDATPADAPGKTGSAAEWIQWIGQFLLTGEFTGETDSMEKMRAIIVQLFLADRIALKKIFDKKGQEPFARVQLHDMFIGQPGYLERDVLYMLEQYREEDIDNLLNTKDLGIDHADAGKILMRLLTPGKKVKDITELRQLAVSSPFFIEYLTGGTSYEGLKTFIERTGTGWGHETAGTIRALREILTEAVPGNLERDKLLTLLLQFNLLVLSGKIYVKSGKAYFQAFFAYMQQAVSYTVPVAVWKTVLAYSEEQRSPVHALPEESYQTFKKEIVSLLRHAETETRIRQTEQIPENDAVLKEKKDRQLEQIRAEIEKERQREQERLEKEMEKLQQDKNNKIYIRNAGLVLLHPFMGTYFRRLGLLTENRFVDDAAQQRAVMLLQYLVNGRTEQEEFELVLNKILCGMPVEEPVPLAIELTEDEIAVSAEIFQVLFQRWEKMKNTSVEGFRASFLQREGALSRNEEGWELRVEQRTYDMLLTTLPWAFGMIKNTWMTKILTVEWT